MWIGKFGGLDDEVESLFLLLREESALPFPSVLVLDGDDLRRVVLVFDDFPPLLFFTFVDSVSRWTSNPTPA